MFYGLNFCIYIATEYSVFSELKAKPFTSKLRSSR